MVDFMVIESDLIWIQMRTGMVIGYYTAKVFYILSSEYEKKSPIDQ